MKKLFISFFIIFLMVLGYNTRANTSPVKAGSEIQVTSTTVSVDKESNLLETVEVITVTYEDNMKERWYKCTVHVTVDGHTYTKTSYSKHSVQDACEAAYNYILATEL